ncbi:stalk domain-containing protein [Desulforamulus ruminis]|uniref:stalk domain-containing protein n=1 Tax=Desulforamulus ruminis TaxID=1564 RepID=UPI002FDB9516
MKAKLYTTLALLLILGLTAPAQATPMKVFVEGKEVGFSATPFIQKDVTMVPMREFFEAMGAEVSYFPLNQQITARKNGTEVHMQINYYPAYVNGKQTWLTAAPTLVDGKTYIPLRFVGEAFDAEVSYNEAWGTIDIRSRLADAQEPDEQPEQQESSRIAWQLAFTEPVNGLALAEAAGELVVSSGAVLYKYNEDSKKIWELDLSRKSQGKAFKQKLGVPVISSNGQIYVGSNDREESFGFTKSLYHVKPNGQLNWDFLGTTPYQGKTMENTAGAVVAPQNYVYTTMKKSLFQVYVDGTKKWEYNTSKELSSCIVPVGSDGEVLILEAEAAGWLYKIDERGNRDWYREIPGANDGKIVPLPNKNRVVVLSQSPGDKEIPSSIYCIDSQTGNNVWTFRSKEKITSPLSVRGDAILYSTESGIQSLNIDGKNPSVLIREKAELAPVVSSDGDLLIYTGDNTIKLFNKQGELEWSAQMPARPISITAGERRFYIVTENNLLLSIKK